MQVTTKTVPERTEILANDHYVGIPILVQVATPTTVVKAGTPLTINGALATGSDAAGILLYDVAQNNPNGTIIVHGFIETKRAEAWSGVTVSNSMKTAMPMVRFN